MKKKNRGKARKRKYSATTDVLSYFTIMSLYYVVSQRRKRLHVCNISN